MYRYYKVKMRIKNNVFYGRLKIEINGNNANGLIEYKNIKTQFYNGVIENNKIEFSGNFKMFFTKINYKAKGDIYNDKINIIVTTSKGDFLITGIREDI